MRLTFSRGFALANSEVMLNLENRPPLFFKKRAARWGKVQKRWVGWILVSWQAKQGMGKNVLVRLGPFWR